MNDNVKEYHITLIPHQDKGVIMSLVPMAVRKRLPQRTKEFTADLTKEQIEMLKNTGAIHSIDDIQELESSTIIEEQAISSKTVNYIRRQQTGWPTRSTGYEAPSAAVDDIAAGYYNYNTSDNMPPLGNWGLLRHTSPTKSNSQFGSTRNQGASGTYTAPQFYNVGTDSYTTLDGEGVDLILNVESIIDVADSEFMTDGVTRIEQLQWNTLPLRYPPNDPDGNTAGDLILDDFGQQQLNSGVQTIQYVDDIEYSTGYFLPSTSMNATLETIDIGSDTSLVTVGDTVSIIVHPDDENLLNSLGAINGALLSANFNTSPLGTYDIRTVDTATGLITLSERGQTAIKDLSVYSTTSESIMAIFPNVRFKLVNFNSRVQTANSSTYSPSGVGDHGEAVAYCACSNTYGAGTGAKIYLWPRNQTGEWEGLRNNGWDSFRLFHQNKVANGNTRPTIVIDSIGTSSTSAKEMQTGIFYRNELYTSVAPAGTPEFSVRGYQMFNADRRVTGTAYGHSDTTMAFGDIKVGADHSRGNTPYALPFSDSDKSAFLNLLNADWSASHYYVIGGVKACQEMMQSGVHHISSAGNSLNTIAIKGDPDYNNGVFVKEDSNENVLGDFSPYNRGGFSSPSGSILTASLTPFYYQNSFDGKEVLSDFSTRGSGVDTACAGESIFVKLRLNGLRNLAGTSFASPTLAGFLTLVLQQYPTTTPNQLRRFVRDHAVATDKCYDSGIQPVESSKFGDSAYFNDTFGNRGYSGNIFYLDTNANNWTDPTSLSSAEVTYTPTYQDNQIDFTIDQINSKLDTVTG